MKFDKSCGRSVPPVVAIEPEYRKAKVDCAFTCESLKSIASLNVYVVPALLV